MTMGMVVGEVLASAVLKVVVAKLSSVIGPEVSLLWKFKDDLESMRSTLVTLQAVMNDAEKRSSREEHVRLWLKRLKSAAYDIEDMLAELEFKNVPKDSVRGLSYGVIRKVEQFGSHITIAHKMKNIRHRLEKIKDEAKLDIFNFKVDSCSFDEDINSRATFSSVGEDIVGRAMEKETIVSMLTKYSEEDILTISIYGFGGLGKTTLARLAFNDECVGRVFDCRVWVYVYINFDLKKIGESIISEIEDVNCCHANLQDVTRHLQRVLADKKFLIVLDDVWEENGCQLVKLRTMLKGRAKGSKIIITTRSQKISALMQPNIPYKLDVLSDDDCWILFRRGAFVPGREDPRKEGIGRDIVKKFKGVPLCAQALGFVMRFKESVAAWEAVRDSEIWEMEEDQNIMPSLKLSYYCMPSHLRLCFVYCAVFSKGSVIDKYMLIQQWIALGLIQPAIGSLTLEKRGEEYVAELVSMSFLQVPTMPSLVANHQMKAAKVFQMHDLVYGLARYFANEEFLFLDAKRSGTSFQSDDAYRYVVLVNHWEMPANNKALLGKARALHFWDCKEGQFFGKSFSVTLSKFLRVLDISGCFISELPSQINQMNQLRYLDASGMQIQMKQQCFVSLQSLQALNLSASFLEKLPVQIGNLHKLHYLNLHGCSQLMLLPESFGELGDLLHLDLSGCINLRVLPTSFGKLHKLSFLDMSGCISLFCLPDSSCNLCHLEYLNLSSCHELRELPESFGSLQQLLMLDISDCQKIHTLPISLCSLSHLEDLDLSCCYELQELPKDIGKLHGLRVFDLNDCHRLQALPDSFTNLMNLENLILSECWELRKLPESFGNLCKVRVLDLSCCSQLFALPESFTSLTNLEQLNLSCCISLQMMPGYYGNLKKLKVLNISYCFKIHIPRGISDMCDLRCLLSIGLHDYSADNRDDMNCVTSLMGMPEIAMTGKVNLDSGIFKHKRLRLVGLSNVQNLDEVEKLALCRQQQLNSLILGCTYLHMDEVADTVPTDAVLEKLIPPRTLEHLELFGYCIVDRFPEWMLNLTSFIPNLVHLKLSILVMCDHLPPLGQLPRLQSLVLEDLANVKDAGEVFAGCNKPFIKLRYLKIAYMPNLERCLTTLSTINEEEPVYMFPNLHYLKVSQCPKLRFEPSLPQCLLLEIDMCDEILLGPPETSSQSHLVPTRRIIIQDCKMSSSRGNQLQFLTSLSTLKSLSLNRCDGFSTWGESIGALTCLEELELSLSDVPVCLGSITSLQSLNIQSCRIPCDFPQHLLQLSFLQKLRMSGCTAEFEVPGETARSILAHIPDINIYHVGCIRCIEQKNGTLSVCQLGPIRQVQYVKILMPCQIDPNSPDSPRSSGDNRRVGHFYLKPRLLIKRLLEVLQRKPRRRRGVIFLPTSTRTGNKAPGSRQQSDGEGEPGIYMGDLIDSMRMSSSFHHLRTIELSGGITTVSLALRP